MRALAAALLLAAILSAGPLAGPGDAAGRTLTIDEDALVRCDALDPDVGAMAVDITCTAAIRPGAASNACTLNFVVTDGIDLYIGAAGHCSHVGKRLTVAGVPGTVGTAVISKSVGLHADWAFYRIDPEDRVHVDPTMCRFGGPFATALGAHRAPVAGEVVLHYGHGASHGSVDATRGRVGAPVIPLSVLYKSFAFAGSVDYGDSGSPVRAATGEAIGIAIATVAPGPGPQVVFATNFADAVAELAAHLGRPVWTVEGEMVPDWVTRATE